MLRRLEQEILLADLTSVEVMLARRSRETDPVGWFQLSKRKSQIEKNIADLKVAMPHRGIAIFFGGKPVMGSHGIAADFGAAMISHFQSLVSIQSASLDGVLGERGPIPQRDKSQMFITDIARGSFGFVLEDGGTVNDNLSPIMEDVCDLLARLGSEETERFDSATDTVDARMLPTLQGFFKTLEENKATLRLVSEEDSFDFTKEAIERARERTETLQVLEPIIETVTGRVFIIPDARRFELFPIGERGVIKGGITASFVEVMFDKDYFSSQDFMGKVAEVKLRVRETRLRGAFL